MLLQSAEQLVVGWSQIWTVRGVIDALDGQSLQCFLCLRACAHYCLTLFAQAFLYQNHGRLLLEHVREKHSTQSQVTFYKCCDSPRLADQLSCAAVRSCRKRPTAAGGATKFDMTRSITGFRGALRPTANRTDNSTYTNKDVTVNCF